MIKLTCEDLAKLIRESSPFDVDRETRLAAMKHMEECVSCKAAIYAKAADFKGPPPMTDGSRRIDKVGRLKKILSEDMRDDVYKEYFDK